MLVNVGAVLGSLASYKWDLRVSEVRMLTNSVFQDLMRFGIDCWMVLKGIWSLCWSHIASKINGLLDRSWKGSRAPNKARPILNPPAQGPRGG